MPAQIDTYRYGEARGRSGLTIGVTRHPPRGVRRADYVTRGYFDVWLPLLGPSPPLLADLQQERITFATFSRRYRTEMKQPAPRQVIRLLAAVAQRQQINLGCYCTDAARCHRTLLAGLIAAAAETSGDETGNSPRTFASPACSMPEIED